MCSKLRYYYDERTVVEAVQNAFQFEIAESLVCVVRVPFKEKEGKAAIGHLDGNGTSMTSTRTRKMQCHSKIFPTLLTWHEMVSLLQVQYFV